MFSSLFHIVLYQPLFNLFVFLYNILPAHDVGLVILLVTVIIRLVLYPLTSAGLKAQKTMQELAPKQAEIQKKFANDKQAQAQATMELYKNNKVNPVTSCLPTLLQIPVLYALYRVFSDGLLSKDLNIVLYSFVHNPEKINAISLGFLNLSQPSYVLAVLAGLAQFWQARGMIRTPTPKEAGEGGKDENTMAIMNKQMLYIMPVMTVVIGIRFPAGLTLYWFLSTLFMALQQWFLNRRSTSSIVPVVVEKEKV